MRVVLVLGLLTTCLPTMGEATLRAERISEANAAGLLIGGPDAIGGVGDWYLANDRIELIVDDPSRAHGKSNRGGTLIDVGLVGVRGEDQFNRLIPILNLNRRVFPNPDAIHAEVNESQGWARLVVASHQGMSSLPRRGRLARLLDILVPAPEELATVRIKTEYRLRHAEPFVRITTTLRNTGKRSVKLFAYGDLIMRGRRGLRAFMGNTLDPAAARGFSHLSFDRSNVTAAGKAMAPFTHLSLTGVREFAPISYSLYSPELESAGVPFFGVTDDQVSLMLVFTFEHGWDRLSLGRIGRAIFKKLPAGAEWSYTRRLLVTGSRSVASATDHILPELGWVGDSGIEGTVEPAGVPHMLHVSQAGSGAPVTAIVSEGSFSAALPPGEYDLAAVAPARAPVEQRFRVAPGARTRLEIRLAEPSLLDLAALRPAAPVRILVSGLGDTPDPAFQPDLTGFSIDGIHIPGAGEGHGLLITDGSPEAVPIRRGSYRLTAVRGLEFDLARAEIEIGDGRVPAPPLRPRRIASLPDFLAADFHVHSEASDDTNLPRSVRVASALTAGLQVMTATDHDHLGSYDAALDAMADARARLRVLDGAEITSSAPSAAAPYGIGHTNAWPLRFTRAAHRGGAPPSQNLPLADLYSLLRRDYGATIIQMNHPREEGVGQSGYFNHMGIGRSFDPERPLTEPPNSVLLKPGSDGHTRPIDFDALELMNGPSVRRYLRVRRDLYSLLRQGVRRTGTGVSDSHGTQGPMLPRSYVLYPAGLGGFDEEAFNQAIREGRLFCTTGPLLSRFEVNGGVMGDLVAARDGKVQLRLKVDAAPWVPVQEVRVLVNGELARSFAGGERDGSVVLETELEIELAGDAFITLEAGAALLDSLEDEAPPPEGDYALVAPGFTPMAFANPIYVDVDGNGRFDPPGL